MKRLFTLMLAVVILLSLTVTAYAEVGGTTELRTKVYSGSPTWNLRIPANTYIPYNQTVTELDGYVAVENLYCPDDATGYVDVSLEYDNLRKSYGYGEIYLSIIGEYYDDYYYNTITHAWNSGGPFAYSYDYSDYRYYEHAASRFYNSNDYEYRIAPPIHLRAEIPQSEWDNANPGEYSTDLVFTSSFTFTDNNN